MNVGRENLPTFTRITTAVVTVGTSAVQLPQTGAGLVYMRGAPTNTALVTFGGSDVTAGNGYTLAASEVTPPIMVKNLADLYAISDAADQDIEILVQQ